MYLKSLEISGFKSFAKKANLKFDSPISAIVGPNGSGKSNIAEAFRFVLGEQSMKSLRGKRGEDLIWNGAGDGGRANRASVKVVFDNSRRFLPIDFEEVIIERAVYRDSVNEYLINGSQVRLKDVLELLSAAHIGSSGHHIISQGEADKILNSSSRDRKTMIEDALGLKIYQYKCLESGRKLLKTEENIKSVISLRREIAPHIKFLFRQVEKIEKAKTMRGELGVLYKEYFARENLYLTETRKILESKLKSPREKLATLEHELARAKKVLEDSVSKDSKTEEVIRFEKEMKTAREEKDALLRELGRLEGEIFSLKKIIEREQKSSRAENTTVSAGDIRALVEKVEPQIETLKENPTSLFTLIKSTIDSLKNFIKYGEYSGSVTGEVEEEMNSLEEKRKGLDTRVKEAEQKEKELQREYNKIRQEIEKDKDSSRDAEKAVFRILSEESRIRAELQKLSGEEDRLSRDKEAFARELDEAKVFVGQAVWQFKDFTLSEGEALTAEIVISESRGKQEERRKTIEKIKIRLEDMGGGGGEEILKEYKEVSERDAFLERELTDLEKSADDLKKLIEELGKKLQNEFADGVAKINKEFQEFFELMFGGGSASLSITKEKKRKRISEETSEGMETFYDEEDKEEIEEGIEVSVSLPRKRIKGLMMLSGGERALTSIALLFAMSQVKPPPFIILDETDAALDEANSRKYSDMVENLSKSSQLILITHNRETMSRAGVLYGVTMDSSGISKVLSVKFDEAVAVAK
ncbi:MAG: hypothetical protein KAR00_01495 [Candidatus Pacebacteria bacterium]|nr:hypothetical protein [Candidatus Paceibacterota bacterium]